MTVYEVYGGGKFHDHALAQLLRETEVSESGYSIVAAVGVPGAGKSTLLNQIFGTTFPEGATAAALSAHGGAESADGAGLRDQAPREGAVRASRAEPLSRSLLLAQPPRDVIVLDVDGLGAADADPTAGGMAVGADKREERARAQRKTAVDLAVALADVIVFNVRMHDLPRSRASGMRQLRSALETYLRLRAASMLSREAPNSAARHNKRLLFVAVRDFDDDDASREDVTAAFLEDFAAMWNRLTKPARFVQTRYTELFDIKLVTLPHATHRTVDFMLRVGELQRQFLDPTADLHLFRAAAYANAIPPNELALHADSVYKSLREAEREAVEALYGKEGAAAAAVNSAELEAAYRCDQISSYIFSQFLENVRTWKSRAEDGRIIENFGRDADALVNDSLAEYDKDAAAFASARSYGRKRAELRAAMLNDLRTIYAKQVLKLREVAFDRFKLALTRVQVTDRVEKDVERQIKAAEKYFVEQAELLKCRDAPRTAAAAASPAASGALAWRHDVERRALIDAMREVATERLQFARLQGAYVPIQRQPIQCSFHYLHPHPFGMDSRFDRPTHADPMRYEPNAGTRAVNTMRAASVHQGNTRIKLGGKVQPMSGGKSSDLVFRD